jgi:hypothetical protein
MILEAILIFFVIFMILTFFYKQAINEFRINQIEWSQKDKIRNLLNERVPLVVRDIPNATFWTKDDISVRHCYDNLPIFKDIALKEWITNCNENVVCPWEYKQANLIGDKCGLSIWAEKWLNSIILNPILSFYNRPKYYCWGGAVGLQKTYAPWTCIFPVDGEIVVSIMPETAESSLPRPWRKLFPSKMTAADTPFLSDLKFMDIIVRPGNALFMPSHWFVSWEKKEESGVCPLVCNVAYHNLISSFAFAMSIK